MVPRPLERHVGTEIPGPGERRADQLVEAGPSEAEGPHRGQRPHRGVPGGIEEEGELTHMLAGAALATRRPSWTIST